MRAFLRIVKSAHKFYSQLLVSRKSRLPVYKLTLLSRGKATMSRPSAPFVDIKLPCTEDPFEPGVDAFIDVRSPSEYEEDHIPGAINLPVLTNEERCIVGKEYSLNSFEARRNGAALISSNISSIIHQHFMDKPKTYSCVIYCWRGGQRSKSLALILSMIGYDVKFLIGGYKTYRTDVVTRLSTLPGQFSYKVIGGMTGCGKTLLLQQLKNAGEQILDLEALANHKGSVLGVNYEDINQPSPKKFESRLLEKFMTYNPEMPVWIEAEGRKIGTVHIPSSVFDLIRKNVINSYLIQSPIEARVKYLLREYKYLTENTDQLKESLSRLSKFNAPLKRWYQLIDENKGDEFVFDILKNHYDPMYKKSHTKSFAKDTDLSKKVIINLEHIDANHMQKFLSEEVSSRNESNESPEAAVALSV